MKFLRKHSVVLITMLLMLMAVVVMRAPFLGWQLHTVVSASMSPVLQVGEVVVTKQVDPTTIEVGDIITFRSPIDGQLVCHRVIGINQNERLYFQTMGDANKRPDLFQVPAENVAGVIRFHSSILAQIGDVVRSPLSLIMLGV